MQTNNVFKFTSILVVITLLGNMLLPVTVQAIPQATPHPASGQVVSNGEVFMTAAPEAMGNALQLAQLLDYISQVNLGDLDEAILVQSRQYALTTAQQSAIAQGAVGGIAHGMRQMDLQHIRDAANMDDVVTDLETQGFDAELETALADFGLTTTQIDTLETQAADNFNIRRTGLTTETVAALQDAGLTGTEITQLQQALANYGLANNSLSDRLAQLKAGQQELGIVHTEALVAYLQLLTKQVFVRQINGQPAREMTTTEINALVQDQLRLLIHLGYLDNLGSTPDVGEGQWLFIERYSLRVVERLEAIILETQNVGLVVDLFVALQVHGTALAALNGDLAFAREEVEPLADFLATLLGDNLPGGQQARYTAPPFWWESALAMGDLNPAEWVGYEPALEEEAVAVAQEQLQSRVRGLASPLWFPQTAGVVNETNETNNTAEEIFYTAAPHIPPGLMQVLNEKYLQGSTLWEFMGEVLTGNTENGWAIGANVVLGFWPITGIIVDIAGLMYAPSNWERAFAMIGLAMSVVTDVGEALGAIAALIPETLLGTVPAAIALEVMDAGASVLKNARHFVKAEVYKLLKNIPYDTILRKIGPQLLMRLADQAVRRVGEINWPTGQIAQILNVINDVLHATWDPFVALLTYLSQKGLWDRLDDIGFDDGGFLAGRVLNLSAEAATYGEETIPAIARIGDDLGGVATNLSDNAVQGLGDAANTLGERNTRQIFSECFIGVVTQVSPGKSKMVAGLASPLLDVNELCENSLSVYRQLSAQDPSVKRAIEEIANTPFIIDLDTFLDEVAAGALSIDTARDVLQIVDEVPHTALNGRHLDLMAHLLTTGKLDKETLKLFPLNTVDDTYGNFYRGLEEYLPHSTFINDKKGGKLIRGVAGDVGDVLGEYRERRYLRHIYNEANHTRVYDKFGQDVANPLVDGGLDVSKPGFDAITKKGDTYFIGEAKDVGGRQGTILDGPSGGSGKRLDPSKISFMKMENDVWVFDEVYFENEMRRLRGKIENVEFLAIQRAVRNDQLKINIFVGGGDEMIASSLRSIGMRGLPNPFNPNKNIEVNIILD